MMRAAANNVSKLRSRMDLLRLIELMTDAGRPDVPDANTMSFDPAHCIEHVNPTMASRARHQPDPAAVEPKAPKPRLPPERRAFDADLSRGSEPIAVSCVSDV